MKNHTQLATSGASVAIVYEKPYTISYFWCSPTIFGCLGDHSVRKSTHTLLHPNWLPILLTERIHGYGLDRLITKRPVQFIPRCCYDLIHSLHSINNLAECGILT